MSFSSQFYLHQFSLFLHSTFEFYCESVAQQNIILTNTQEKNFRFQAKTLYASLLDLSTDFVLLVWLSKNPINLVLTMLCAPSPPRIQYINDHLSSVWIICGSCEIKKKIRH